MSNRSKIAAARQSAARLLLRGDDTSRRAAWDLTEIADALETLERMPHEGCLLAPDADFDAEYLVLRVDSRCSRSWRERNGRWYRSQQVHTFADDVKITKTMALERRPDGALARVWTVKPKQDS